MLVAGTTKHKSEHKTQHGKPARSITKSEYKEVLQNTLLHEGTKLFKKACISEWFMQQDNDPCHNVASQIVQDWNVANRSNVQVLLDWPPSSPDLNIIENVWALVQRQVNSSGCKDFGGSSKMLWNPLLGCLQRLLPTCTTTWEWKLCWRARVATLSTRF